VLEDGRDDAFVISADKIARTNTPDADVDRDENRVDDASSVLVSLTIVAARTKVIRNGGGSLAKLRSCERSDPTMSSTFACRASARVTRSTPSTWSVCRARSSSPTACRAPNRERARPHL